MPQEFQVLQCYSCETFQVHQVKKTTKWACKMCGEKQSLKKVFGRGSGADCRQHVQRLNAKRAEVDHQTTSTFTLSHVQTDLRSTGNDGINIDGHISQANDEDFNQHNKETKWNMFVESNHSEHTDGDDDDRHDDDSNDRYTTDAQKFKQGRKRKRETTCGINSLKRNNKSYQPTNTTSTCTGAEGLYDYSMYNVDTTRNQASYFGTGHNRAFKSGTEFAGDTVRDSRRKFETDSYSENHFQNSFQSRKDWPTSELNEFSTQESIVSTSAETFSGRIRPLSCSSRNFEIEKVGDKYREINTQVNTKWGLFTEKGTSTQESSADSSQGLPEDSYDSRPYVTFDSEETENVGDDRLNTGLSYNNSSKWTGFITCKKDVEQSGQIITSNQTGSVSCENNIIQSMQKSSSKWNNFLTVEDKVSGCVEYPESANEKENDAFEHINSKFDAHTSDIFKDAVSARNNKTSCNVSKSEDRLVLNSSNAIDKQNVQEKTIRTIGKKGDRIEKVVPVFTAGDLDDTDFDL